MREWIRTIAVGILIFFGSAFTIMAFHNDIGLVTLFEQMYEQVLGTPAKSMGGLEIGYSIGLAAGIIFFFDHLKRKKNESDPTPLQVEMFKYDQDVKNAREDLKKRQENSGKKG